MANEAHDSAGVGKDVTESECVAEAIDNFAIRSGREIGFAGTQISTERRFPGFRSVCCDTLRYVNKSVARTTC